MVECMAVNVPVNKFELVGPIKRGTWIQLGDDPSWFHKDDSVSIVVESDIPAGQRECYGSLDDFTETTKTYTRYRKSRKLLSDSRLFEHCQSDS